MSELLQAERGRYAEDKPAAKALLSVGERTPDESLDITDHAAWTILASVILNLDETLNKE